MAWIKEGSLKGPQGPPGPTDYATLDARYVNVTGDTVTGDLNIQGETFFTNNVYIDNHKDLTVSGSIQAWTDGTEHYLKHIGCDSIWVNTSFQVYSPIYLDGTANVPTDPRHATSKQYVDDAIAAAGGGGGGGLDIEFADTRYVNATGDGMSGPLTITTTGAIVPLTLTGGSAFTDHALMVTQGMVEFQDGLLVAGEFDAMGDVYLNGYLQMGSDVGFPPMATSDLTLGNDASGDYWLTATELRLYDKVIASTRKARIYYNAGVLTIGDSTTGTGTLTGVQIKNVPLTLALDPTLPLHAATKQYVDAKTFTETFTKAVADPLYVDVAGDSMTGKLTITTTASEAMRLVRGAAGTIVSQTFYTQGTVKSGEIIVGGSGLTINSNITDSTISLNPQGGGGLAIARLGVTAYSPVYVYLPPTDDYHLTNKLYVDTAVAGAGGGFDQTMADALYVNTAGDTMSGSLIINGTDSAFSMQITRPSNDGCIAFYDSSFSTYYAWVMGRQDNLNLATASSGTVTLSPGNSAHLTVSETDATFNVPVAMTDTLTVNPGTFGFSTVALGSTASVYCNGETLGLSSNPDGYGVIMFQAGDVTPFWIDNGGSHFDLPVLLADDPTAPLQAATKQYVDTKWTAWTGTQTDYDALGTYDPGTLYVVKG